MAYRGQMKGAAAALLLLMGVVIAAQKDSATEAREAVSLKAPANWGALQNPYERESGAVLAGKKLFRHHCAECHGAQGQGTERAPSLRAAGAIQSAKPGALFWFLTNGSLKRGMPSWSGLPPQRRWQLVSYIQSLGRRSEERQAETMTGLVSLF